MQCYNFATLLLEFSNETSNHTDMASPLQRIHFTIVSHLLGPSRRQ